MFGATVGNQNPHREIGSWLGSHLQPEMVFPVLLSKEIEEKLATSLTANVFSLLQYMNSLPSDLPQRPHLPNILFVSLPSQALHFVYIFPLNLAPSPANCSSRAESSKEDGCQAWHRIWSLCAPRHAQGFPPAPSRSLVRLMPGGTGVFRCPVPIIATIYIQTSLPQLPRHISSVAELCWEEREPRRPR